MVGAMNQSSSLSNASNLNRKGARFALQPIYAEVRDVTRILQPTRQALADALGVVMGLMIGGRGGHVGSASEFLKVHLLVRSAAIRGAVPGERGGHEARFKVGRRAVSLLCLSNILTTPFHAGGRRENADRGSEGNADVGPGDNHWERCQSSPVLRVPSRPAREFAMRR